MKQGFVKVAAVTPQLKVADVQYNTQEICRLIDETVAQKAKVIVFPELAITGYTCGDLVVQDILLRQAKEALLEIAAYTKGKDALIFVGVPLIVHGKLFNIAAALNDGKILGLVTKTFLPNYSEFYEMRSYQMGPKVAEYIQFNGEEVPFGPQILFQSREMEELVVAAEVCEDVWSPIPPSIGAALRGATVLVNTSASSETAGKDSYRQSLISGQSARLIAAYIYANAGTGESTTDLVFGGHNIIAENGTILSESKRFANETIYAEIDVYRLVNQRRQNTTFQMEPSNLITVPFSLKIEETDLTRVFPREPFIPEEGRAKYLEEVLLLQALGLKKRLEHTNCKRVVLGLSGGLDSTLALLVAAEAVDLKGGSRDEITAVTMPCFGTTDRTYNNACALAKQIGAKLLEVPIADAVIQHFRDIGHDPEQHDVTYENAQARERTQVLMDIANKYNGMVIGTGDMSELALGWATYNGDHMSMYAVNSSVPKTMVRHLVAFSAATCEDKELSAILTDILDTPVSPELLPPTDGDISQVTEDLVGPYELHDYFLYYMLRYGYEPSKIYRLAKITFEGVYESETILKWMRKFYWRFFSQQFKRSCMPDGVKTGNVALSPRGSFRMPSDACATVWLKDLEGLK